MNDILYFINFWLRDKIIEKHSFFLKIFNLCPLSVMIYNVFLSSDMIKMDLPRKELNQPIFILVETTVTNEK